MTDYQVTQKSQLISPDEQFCPTNELKVCFRERLDQNQSVFVKPEPELETRVPDALYDQQGPKSSTS